MGLIGIIFLLITIAIGVLCLYFPVYAILFIPRRLKAKKIGPGAGPSILTLALYFLVVVLFLATVLPAFLNFATKAKQNEAKQNLGAIFTCQTAYFGENNEFAGGPFAFKLIHWDPDGKNSYAYYCGDDMIENKNKSRTIEAAPGPDWPYEVRPGASDTGFTCMAVGNIDGDDYPDVWAINETKVLAKVRNDVYNDKPNWATLFMAICIPFLLLSFRRDSKRHNQARARENNIAPHKTDPD